WPRSSLTCLTRGRPPSFLLAVGTVLGGGGGGRGDGCLAGGGRGRVLRGELAGCPDGRAASRRPGPVRGRGGAAGRQRLRCRCVGRDRGGKFSPCRFSGKLKPCRPVPPATSPRTRDLPAPESRAGAGGVRDRNRAGPRRHGRRLPGMAGWAEPDGRAEGAPGR